MEIFGVSVVDGDHPYSDYFAAVLNSSDKEANAAANAAGMPVRFSGE